QGRPVVNGILDMVLHVSSQTRPAVGGPAQNRAVGKVLVSPRQRDKLLIVEAVRLISDTEQESNVRLFFPFQNRIQHRAQRGDSRPCGYEDTIAYPRRLQQETSLRPGNRESSARLERPQKPRAGPAGIVPGANLQRIVSARRRGDGIRAAVSGPLQRELAGPARRWLDSGKIPPGTFPHSLSGCKHHGRAQNRRAPGPPASPRQSPAVSPEPPCAGCSRPDPGRLPRAPASADPAWLLLSTSKSKTFLYPRGKTRKCGRGAALPSLRPKAPRPTVPLWNRSNAR